jgi:hypothetical protein
VTDSIALPAERVVVIPDDPTAEVSSQLADHWVCVAWDGHVLPGVWDTEVDAVARGSQTRYEDEVTRVVQVRDLPADRQADASRHYETVTVRAGSEA